MKAGVNINVLSGVLFFMYTIYVNVLQRMYV